MTAIKEHCQHELSVKARHLLAQVPLLPILNMDSANDYNHLVSLGDALLEAGISVLEVTLRSSVSLKAIEYLVHKVPGLAVGAGTVRSKEQLQEVVDSGAAFALSPGITLKLLQAAIEAQLPFVPGIATASELMQASDAGFSFCKVFPAERLGGVQFIRSLAGPFPECEFCPTGGIGFQQSATYFKCRSVVCVGMSQLLPNHLLAVSQKNELIQHLKDALSTCAQ